MGNMLWNEHKSCKSVCGDTALLLPTFSSFATGEAAASGQHCTETQRDGPRVDNKTWEIVLKCKSLTIIWTPNAHPNPLHLRQKQAMLPLKLSTTETMFSHEWPWDWRVCSCEQGGLCSPPASEQILQWDWLPIGCGQPLKGGAAHNDAPCATSAWWGTCCGEDECSLRRISDTSAEISKDDGQFW